MSGPATKVFVIDDHPFFRSGVVGWLKQQAELECCGEADSVASARAALATSNPDVVLLDLRLKDGHGLDFTAELRETKPAVRVLIFSQSDEVLFAHRALKAGARGYIMKGEGVETLLDAIHTVMKGEIHISRSVSARLLHNLFPDPASAAPDLLRLSDRELQVFQLLGARCRNAEISALLKISSKTVDTYRENLKQKLGQPNSDALIQAAARWVETGEFTPRAAVLRNRKPKKYSP